MNRKPQVRTSKAIEESFDLKRMFLRAILAAIPAVLLPLSAMSQAAPPEAPGPAGQGQPSYKYEAYAGFGYTSLNQVNGSRFGLIGADLSLTRDWGRYFGLSGMVNYYKPPLSFGNSSSTVNGITSSNDNPGDPSVYEVLVGPEIHATIYDSVSGFIHGGLGVEHTGGEHQNPNLSFAGGFGGGLSYNLSPRWAIRASGDKIGAAFTVINPIKGDSAHRTWNSSGTIGILFRF
jgi:opacity protein-like surface antigen